MVKSKRKKTSSKKATKLTESKPIPFSKREKAKAYLELSRIGNTLMSGVAVLVGYFLAYGNNPFGALLAVVSGMFVCAGGQAINDYFDSKIDAKEKKTRPIPSGRITLEEAFRFSVALFLIGILLSYLINQMAFFIAVIMSILLIAYPLFMNRIKYLGNFVVALGTGITFIYGAIASGNGFFYAGAIINSTPIVVGFLAAAAFLVNLGREITKDIEDYKIDYGTKRTLPMIVGKNISKLFVIFYYALAVSAVFSASITFNLNSYFNSFAVVSAAILFIAVIVLIKGDAKKSQKFSKVAMLTNLLAFVLSLI